jgi:CHAT domain-containing protein
VSDEVTEKLMYALYSGMLLHGLSPPDALQKAQRSTRKLWQDSVPPLAQTQGETQDPPSLEEIVEVEGDLHPFWWAPFFYVGA